MYLWRCFWMKLIFESVDWLKQIALPKVGGPCPPTVGLNKTKGGINKNDPCLTVLELGNCSLLALGLELPLSALLRLRSSDLGVVHCCTVSFPGAPAGKQFAHSVGDLGSIPGLGRYPGEGQGYPLQYSDLENSMDCIVHGVMKSQTRLSNFHFHWTIMLMHGL